MSSAFWLKNYVVYHSACLIRSCNEIQSTGVVRLWQFFVPYLVHADVFTLLHIPHRDSSLLQSSLKAEAAAQVETHHVGPEARIRP